MPEGGEATEKATVLHNPVWETSWISMLTLGGTNNEQRILRREHWVHQLVHQIEAAEQDGTDAVMKGDMALESLLLPYSELLPSLWFSPHLSAPASYLPPSSAPWCFHWTRPKVTPDDSCETMSRGPSSAHAWAPKPQKL